MSGTKSPKYETKNRGCNNCNITKSNGNWLVQEGQQVCLFQAYSKAVSVVVVVVGTSVDYLYFKRIEKISRDFIFFEKYLHIVLANR